MPNCFLMLPWIYLLGTRVKYDLSFRLLFLMMIKPPVSFYMKYGSVVSVDNTFV